MPELDEFDVYLAHASADKPIVRELAAALKQRGLTIWLDEINMIVGRSLRTQMDSGLSKAAFGVVVLSPAFFGRHWTQQELDGLSSLEEPGKERILPVWHDVGFDGVRSFSPTLAGRMAARTIDGVDHVADQLDEAIRTMRLERHEFGAVVRAQTQAGLTWLMGPEWFPQSLRALDAHVDVFLPAAMSAAIDQLGQPKVRPLPDILERSPSLDGTFRSHGRTARGAEATKSELTR